MSTTPDQQPDGRQVRPFAAVLQELARGQVHAEASEQLHALVYTENIEASGGRGGKTIAIPKRIVIVLPPYEGANPVTLTARFRYRIIDGTLRLGYALDRPADALRAAFEDVVDSLSGEISTDIMRGIPA